MIRQNYGIGPLEISGKLCVGHVAVNALDQVRVRTPGDGLVGSCPAFPCFTDHGQAETAGLIAV